MKFRSWLSILGLVFSTLLPLIGVAQTSSLTATITDSDSQTWNNGFWTATLINPIPQVTPSINGVPLTNAQQHLTGSMSGSGVITGTFSDNNYIVPAKTSWQFTICPNASVQCNTGIATVTGASPNLSSTLSAFVTAPRFPASWQSYGYLDVEVSPTPNPGGIYFNVTNSIQRIYYSSAWNNNGGGGSSGVSSINSTTGAFTFTGSGVSCTGTTCTFTAGSSAVTSVFTRTGAVVAASGDYSSFYCLLSGCTYTGTVNGTQLNLTTGLAIGATPPTACGSATGCDAYSEASTAGTPTAGVDYRRADATQHRFLTSVNNGVELPEIQQVGSGTIALATSSISSLGCQTVTAGSVNSAAVTGLLTTDHFHWEPVGSIKAVTGYAPSSSGGLTIVGYLAAGYVNWDVCNWTSGSVTPGAVTLQYDITR